MMRMASVTMCEPTVLLGALAAVTQSIGLVATVSTSYNEPYNVARKFACLDHLSGGRAGWNIVTSQHDSEARNFGGDRQIEHGERYKIAAEFTDVAKGLWDSWDDDAFRRDKSSGTFVDPDKCRLLNHDGDHFRVQGPLNIPRSPQGYPILAQAGSSEVGREFAARTADLIFTAQVEIHEAAAFYADVKGRLHRYGRRPEHVKILPGVMPIVGHNHADAQRKYTQLQSLIHPDVAMSYLSMVLGGANLSSLDPNGPVPDLPEPEGPKSRFRLLMSIARRENLTLGQLAARAAGARGHAIVVGDANQIADHFERWLGERACDGFCVLFPSLPGGLHDFAHFVIPELQRQGLARREYEGRTLRDNLGLPRPPNPHQRPL